MSTLFVHRLTVIDCSYLSPRRGLVGESWQVDLELDGTLDYQGMVVDFGEVKRSIKRHIDEHFDHRLLVPAGHRGLELGESAGGLQLAFETDEGDLIEHRSPRDAVRLIQCERLTPDGLAQTVADFLGPLLPDNVEAVRIRLRPETIDGAFYHYSHGLKHHDGNCQRIAHGHRSRLEILRNRQRATDIEQRWADGWRDIYIGNHEDLVGEPRRGGSAYYAFGYRAAQGQFGLTLPRDRCYLIDSESTVENIAQHIADTLKRDHPRDHFRVYAYEGVDKGAVGEA
jgi:6-pyruvoyl-tetrahydropterin synthase